MKSLIARSTTLVILGADLDNINAQCKDLAERILTSSSPESAAWERSKIKPAEQLYLIKDS